MRDRVAVHVVWRGAIAVEPVAHQFGIEPAFDFADEAVADFEPDFVLHVSAIRQDDDVAGGQHDGPVGRAFVRECVNVSGAPMIEAAGDSAKPYWIIVGYSPRLTDRSVPPGRVMRIVLARLRRSPA